MNIFYYIQINGICILLLGGIWTAIHKKKGAVPADQAALTRIIFLTILLSFSDIFAWLCTGASFAGAGIVVHAANMIYFGTTTAVCYEWLCYINVCIFGAAYDNRKHRLLAALPMLVMLGFIVSNPVTGLLFTVSDGNVYERGPLVAVHWIITCGYMLYGAGISVRRILSSKTRIERRQYVPLLWFFVMPMIGAAMQMLFYGVTTIQCGITLSVILHAYVTLQAQISGDALTGLNNRRALESYLNTQMQRDGKPLSVMMCDIDDFKKINDTLGHAHGDIALKRAAQLLKSACASCRCSVFLCRYGGDEFVICSTGLDENGLLALKNAVDEAVARGNAEYANDIPLSVSIGTARGVCTNDAEAERLLREADEAMYRAKKARGAARK